LNSRADFAQRGGLLEDAHAVAALQQCGGGGQATEAGADDGYFHSIQR
jgi:hypothetical protein